MHGGWGNGGEAMADVHGAIDVWIEAAREMGRPIPEPGAGRAEMRQRLPRTLHTTLTEMARSEGVSLNTFILTLLAEGVGRRDAMPIKTGPSPHEHAPAGK